MIAALRDRVRRAQLMAGVGFAAAALGGIVAAPLVRTLVPWAQRGPPMPLLLLAHALTSQLWAYLVLPGLWFFVARLVRGLRPWRSAIASAMVGEGCYLALDWISGALPGLMRTPAVLLPRLLTLAAGTVLSARAIERAARLDDR